MAYASEQAMPPEYDGIGAFLKRWLTTTDHKEIGILYIVTSFSFFVLGGVMAPVLRTNLADPGSTLVDLGTLNRPLSTPGTPVNFLLLLPLLTRVFHFLMPPLLLAECLA